MTETRAASRIWAIGIVLGKEDGRHEATPSLLPDPNPSRAVSSDPRPTPTTRRLITGATFFLSAFARRREGGRRAGNYRQRDKNFNLVYLLRGKERGAITVQERISVRGRKQYYTTRVAGLTPSVVAIRCTERALNACIKTAAAVSVELRLGHFKSARATSPVLTSRPLRRTRTR